MSISFRLTAALLGAACVGICQSSSAGVIVVDALSQSPFAFINIGAAVAAAANGDVILVRDGTYDQSTVAGKSLTIVADSSALVVVNATPQPGQPAIQIDGTSAPTRVTLRGLTCIGPGGATQLAAGIVVGGGAAVWLESVEVDSFSFPLDIFQATVVANACSFHAAPGDQALLAVGGTAITAQDSTLSLHDVVAAGGQGASAASLAVPAGDGGVSLIGTTLFASGSWILGGQGGSGTDFGGPCIDGAHGGVGLLLV
jgi:hypothetical protein